MMYSPRIGQSWKGNGNGLSTFEGHYSDPLEEIFRVSKVEEGQSSLSMSVLVRNKSQWTVCSDRKIVFLRLQFQNKSEICDII